MKSIKIVVFSLCCLFLLTAGVENYHPELMRLIDIVLVGDADNVVTESELTAATSYAMARTEFTDSLTSNALVSRPELIDSLLFEQVPSADAKQTKSTSTSFRFRNDLFTNGSLGIGTFVAAPTPAGTSSQIYSMITSGEIGIYTVSGVDNTGRLLWHASDIIKDDSLIVTAPFIKTTATGDITNFGNLIDNISFTDINNTAVGTVINNAPVVRNTGREQNFINSTLPLAATNFVNDITIIENGVPVEYKVTATDTFFRWQPHQELIYTAGATLTVTGDITVVYIDPATFINDLTIVLPTGVRTGYEVEFHAGGIIAAGTMVVNTFNLPTSVIGYDAITGLSGADNFTLIYRKSNTTWYIK